MHIMKPLQITLQKSNDRERCSRFHYGSAWHCCQPTAWRLMCLPEKWNTLGLHICVQQQIWLLRTTAWSGMSSQSQMSQPSQARHLTWAWGSHSEQSSLGRQAMDGKWGTQLPARTDTPAGWPLCEPSQPRPGARSTPAEAPAVLEQGWAVPTVPCLISWPIKWASFQMNQHSHLNRLSWQKEI